MPRGLEVLLDAKGFNEAEHDLVGIVHRMRNLHPISEEVQTQLEEGERRYFDRLHGQYVDTGDLLRSLTEEHDANAIREAHGDTIIFGTKLYYAKFLRKGKKSAVLVLQPTTRRKLRGVIMEYIVRGHHI